MYSFSTLEAILYRIMIFILILFILFFTIIYLRVRNGIRRIWKEFFGDKSLHTVISECDLETSSTPKSLYGMGNVYKNVIAKDFPELNLNELLAMAEGYIIDYLNCLENKDKTKFRYVSDKINSFLISQINDLGNNTVSYDSIKIHKTILNRYEKKAGVATMKFQTGLEYMYKKNNSEYKKIQDRFTTEFIYIIDESQFLGRSKTLGLNCPNCGASIKSLGDQYCEYCGTGIKNLVKHSWILNNISQG